MKTPTILRRKREGVTDYRKRLNLLKSESPRLVVRISSRGFVGQIVEYDPDGDLVRATVNSPTMKKHLGISGNNTQVCYAAGYFLGKKALKMDINYAILDNGRHHLIPGGRITSVLKGMLDAGLEVPCSEEILPNEERLGGKHLKNALKIEEIKG
jgi:Ribosomal protein L18